MKLIKFWFLVRDKSCKSKTIPELGSSAAISSIPSNCYDEPSDEINLQKESIVEYVNPPVTAWVYTDIEQKCKFVNVATPIISGTKDLNFKISDDGMKVTINFSWPVAIYQPKELFSNEINDDPLKGIPVTHPKIHTLSTQLLAEGISEKSIPRGKMIVSLPIKVQREVGSWTKKAVTKPDGTRIVLLQFKGYQENLIINDADTRLIFE